MMHEDASAIVLIVRNDDILQFNFAHARWLFSPPEGDEWRTTIDPDDDSTLRVSGVADEKKVLMTDAAKLAIAVLQGDVDAALLLADEVQIRHAAGDDFVSRAKLLDLLAHAVEVLRIYSIELDHSQQAMVERVLGSRKDSKEIL